jgi:ABC-2 type transport system ATP-binding protein
MIKTEGLMKKFRDVVAVDRLDLEIQPGEIFGFLGPNGAGKTTTVKLMTGLLRPTSGRAWVGGFDVQSDPRRAKKIMGLVPDQPYVYPHLTGNEFLRFIGDLYEVELSYQKRKSQNFWKCLSWARWGRNWWKPILTECGKNSFWRGFCFINPKCCFWTNLWWDWTPKALDL